jgi:hypothetical protein
MRPCWLSQSSASGATSLGGGVATVVAAHRLSWLTASDATTLNGVVVASRRLSRSSAGSPTSLEVTVANLLLTCMD